MMVQMQMYCLGNCKQTNKTKTLIEIEMEFLSVKKLTALKSNMQLQETFLSKPQSSLTRKGALSNHPHRQTEKCIN